MHLQKNKTLRGCCLLEKQARKITEQTLLLEKLKGCKYSSKEILQKQKTCHRKKKQKAAAEYTMPNKPQRSLKSFF